MKWPWISRKRHEALRRHLRAAVKKNRRLQELIHQLAKELRDVREAAQYHLGLGTLESHVALQELLEGKKP